MTVSPGNLDSLQNESFSAADFTSVSLQSDTGLVANPPSYSTVTLNTTGVPGPGTTQGETLSVVGFNDADNSITLSLTLAGQSIAQVTDFVVGYSPDGLLLSGLDQSSIVDLLYGNSISEFNLLVGVLSSAPIAGQTNITFSSSGSSSLTPTPPTTPTPPPPTTPTPTTPTPTLTPGLTVLDSTTNQSVAAAVQTYSGPVAGLTSEYITPTTDSVNINLSTPGWFIHTGSGNDAIAASGGTNVLDGGTGSNFLTGGSGDNTFFVDDRGPTSDIWSTVNNFHSGDAATIWGVSPSDFALSWVDGQGAAGYTGLTLHATAAGVPTASLTLTGFTSADLTDGKLTVSYGTTPASGGVPGSTYMYVHAN